jgi:C4-dicarboxylate transporter
MHEHSATYNLVNGVIGSAASALGVITQFQEQLDWALKMTSTSLLICVSLVTLFNLLKKKNVNDTMPDLEVTPVEADRISGG